MQQKADVFEQVEGPRGRRALVHLLLVFGLMRVDAFKDAQSPENQRGIRNYFFCDMSTVWVGLPVGCPELEIIINTCTCLGVGLGVMMMYETIMLN